VTAPVPADIEVSHAELLGVLSLATDLGTGQPLEHALRTCLLAMRLGELAGVGEADLAAAHELALLHSIGCTADAHEAAILEVLRLLARGLTNRQVAAELGLSAKTVGHHVQHIYAKAGVSSRAAAALFAVEHDLMRA
jgi:DNA-binding CsgD family transcriptional regulator